jgi:hypothetical protein
MDENTLLPPLVPFAPGYEVPAAPAPPAPTVTFVADVTANEVVVR